MTIRETDVDEIKKEYSMIDRTNGVSNEEAIVIAKYYVVANEDYKTIQLKQFQIDTSGFNPAWVVVSFDATGKYKRESGLQWFAVHIERSSGEIKVRGWGPS